MLYTKDEREHRGIFSRKTNNTRFSSFVPNTKETHNNKRITTHFNVGENMTYIPEYFLGNAAEV